MQIEQLSLDQLTPYARNSRTHSARQIEQIAASLREFGFCNPVLIDEAGGIIAGHGRVLAAQAIGLEQVPCIRLAHLTAEQRRAYVIADNKLAENAGWDAEMLAGEIEDLKEISFPIELLGFDERELLEMFEPVEWQTGEEGGEPGATDDYRVTVVVDGYGHNDLKREVAAIAKKYNAKVL